jgi:hypothetical protein
VFGEAVIVDVQRAAGLVVEDEDLIEAGDAVHRRGDAAVPTAADPADSRWSRHAEPGLGEADLGAEFLDSVAEGHEVALRVVVEHAFCSDGCRRRHGGPCTGLAWGVGRDLQAAGDARAEVRDLLGRLQEGVAAGVGAPALTRFCPMKCVCGRGERPR